MMRMVEGETRQAGEVGSWVQEGVQAAHAFQAQDLLEVIAQAERSLPSCIADLMRVCIRGRRSLPRSELIGWCVSIIKALRPHAPTCVRDLAETIADILLTAGEFGRGQSYGQDMIVAVAPFAVEVSGVGLILLGDWPETHLLEGQNGQLVRCLAERLQGTKYRPLQLDTFLGQAEPNDRRMLRDTSQQHSLNPSEAGRVHSVFGALSEDGQTISILPLFRPAIMAWANVDTETSGLKTGSPSEAQRDIVKADPRKLLIVEAGPGSGKTFTACKRVEHLIRECGIEPERILIISFTRVAVAEIRKRLTGGIPDSSIARRVDVVTLDSFAARLLRVAGTANDHGGYSAAVRRATVALKSNDAVLDYIAEFDHVIIDETQDVLGIRKDFCNEMLAAVFEECGVTIFGDRAQRIFDYEDPDGAPSLLEGLCNAGEYEIMPLLEDHRTKSGALREMFKDLRPLIYVSDPSDVWQKVRDRIQEGAVEKDIEDIVLRRDLGDSVILVRTRAEVHALSEQFRLAGIRCRTRLSGRPVVVDPWLGAAAGEQPPESRLTRDDIANNIIAIAGDVTDEIVTRTWERMLSLAGTEHKTVRIGDVVEELSAGAPLELLRDYDGFAGPLISTIHAWKGREASKVVICLRNRVSEIASPHAEARVLFVGATRAIEELRTANAKRTRQHYLIGGRRLWRATQLAQHFEIGLENDLQLARPDTERPHRVERSRVVWQAARDQAALVATGQGGAWNVYRSKSEADVSAISSLAGLSSAFVDDVMRAPGNSARERLPRRLYGFYAAGCTTAITRRGTDGQAQLTLAPIIGGFAAVERNENYNEK